ncbi:MAG TPA: hypothetical protein VKZ50_14730 [bacterium]|nr:hypothetical protein [bacterium]
MVLGVYLFRLSTTNGLNADPASNLLYAADIARGNWLLHGWTLPPDSYWFTDVLIYMVALPILGLNPVLLYVVPVAICLALIAALVVVSTTGAKLGPTIPFVALLPVLPIIFPSPAMISQVLMGPFHTGTLVAALVSTLALYHAQKMIDHALQRWLLAGFALIVLTAAGVSDPYTTIVAVVPIAVVSLARVLAAQRPVERRRSLLSLCTGAAAWLGTLGCGSLVRHLGGATIIPFGASTISYAQIGQSVSNLGRALLDLAGGNVFGQGINQNLAPAALRLTYLAAAMVATWLALRDEMRSASTHRSPEDWLTTVLAAAAAFVFLGNVLGTANEDIRYRLPLLLLAGVVLARRFGALLAPWLSRQKGLAAGLGVALILVYAGPVGQYLHHHPASEYNRKDVALARWLAAHGLHYGYGGYWEASLVTVESQGRVMVRPVVSTKINQPGLVPSDVPSSGWRISPYNWMSKNTWYSATHPANFLVFDPSSQWDRDSGVTLTIATQTFGRPSHVYQGVGQFTVLVWDGPLHF